MKYSPKTLMFLAALGTAALCILPASRAANATWDGGGGDDGNWLTAANWVGNTVPVFNNETDIYFTGAMGNSTVWVGNQNPTIRSLNFTGTANSTVNLRHLVNGAIGAKTLTYGGGATAPSVVVATGATGSFTLGQGSNGGNMVLAGNLTVTHDGTGLLRIDKPVTGNFGITKLGTGQFHLNANNTFTGPVHIKKGLLITKSLNSVSGGQSSSGLGRPTTLANGTIKFGTGYQRGDLRYTGTGETTDRVLQFDGVGGMLLEQAGTGLLKFTGNLSSPITNRTHTLFLTGGASGIGEIAGTITNSPGTAGVVSLTKQGDGTWYLSGNNTYTGNTTVSAGALMVDGNQAAATGNITVASGAAIGGNGTLGGNLTINAGGQFAFGTTPLKITAGKAVRFGGFGVTDVIGLQNGQAGTDYTLIQGGAIDFTNIADMNPWGQRYLGGGRGAYFLNSGGSLKVCVRAMEPAVDVLFFGAVPDDGMDDAPAFAAALNYIVSEGGGTVLAPAGAYDFASRQTIDARDKKVVLAGNGKGVTSLRGGNATGLLRFNNTQNTAQIWLVDLTFTANAGGNAGTAIEIINPSLSSNATLTGLYMNHVDFKQAVAGTDYFYRHIYTSYVRNAEIEDVIISSSGLDLSNAGFYMLNGLDARFENCYSKKNAYGWFLNNYQGNVTFDRCNAVANSYGFDVRAADANYLNAVFTGIHANTAIININLLNADAALFSEIASYVNDIRTQFTDFKLANCANVMIRGCDFSQPYCPYRTNIWLATTTHDVTIKDNLFNGFYDPYNPAWGQIPNWWVNRVYINPGVYNVWVYDCLYPATYQY